MKECKDEVFGIWADPERGDFAETNIPYHLTIELTGRCLGSCIYCYSSSEGATGHTFPAERVYSLIDEARRIGSKGIVWHGGDPILHPDWYDFARYTLDQGLKNICIMPNPMTITPKAASAESHHPLAPPGLAAALALPESNPSPASAGRRPPARRCS